jgi:hypothetical protein
MDCGNIFLRSQECMGEIIKARRPEYIAQEIAMKVHYYNIMRSMTEAY